MAQNNVEQVNSKPKTAIEIRVEKLENMMKEMTEFCPQYAEHLAKGMIKL